MTTEVFKVMYQVHMLAKDEDDNVVQELTTQEPLTLYPHQLDQLAEQVAAVVQQAQAQKR